MHPSLDIRNISRFKPPLRELLESSVAGSTKALFDIVRLLPKVPPAQIERIAFVFFLCLNPRNIPPEKDLESESASNASSAIARAILALRGLSYPGAPVLVNGAAPEVWPRVCKWLHFLESYREFVARINPLHEVDLCSTHCSLVVRLQQHSETMKLIYGDHLVRALIARAWKAFLSDDRPPELIDLEHVCRFLHYDPLTGEALEDYVEGVGGSSAALAKLVVAHLEFFIHNRKRVSSGESILLVHPVLKLLENLAQSSDLSQSAGLVKSLVSLASYVTTLPRSSSCLVDSSIATLAAVIQSTQDHSYTVQALRAGVLLLLVTCTPHSSTIVQTFLDGILAPATIYYSVLQALRPEIDKVRPFTEHAKFTRSPVMPSWKRFEELARYRINIMEHYKRSGGLVHNSLTCDNMVCRKNMDRSDARRCSGCRDPTYCSRECQKADWHEGRHRYFCIRVRSLLSSEPETLSHRDHSFLYILAGVYFLSKKGQLYTGRVGEMLKHRGQMMCSVINFAHAQPCYDVRPVSELLDGSPLFRAQWEAAVWRTSRSNGCMDLVVLVLPNGLTERYWVWARDLGTSETHDALEEIVRGIPLTLNELKADRIRQKEVEAKLEALLKREGCEVNLKFDWR